MPSQIGHCPCCGEYYEDWDNDLYDSHSMQDCYVDVLKKVSSSKNDDNESHYVEPPEENDYEEDYPYIPESRDEAENTDWDGDYSIFDGDGDEYY